MKLLGRLSGAVSGQRFLPWSRLPQRSAPATLCSLVVVAGCWYPGTIARALDIQYFDVGTTPMRTEQLAAFEEAARLWEAKFTDPIIVKINISFDSLPPYVLGSTLCAMTTQRYTNVLAALLANATAEPFAYREREALPLLPATALPITDTNGARSEVRVTMSTANAKALGLGTGLDPLYGGALPNSADASIAYATAYDSSFDYNRSNGISPTKIDFVGVVIHEIGHALGFISLTDVQDNNPGFTLHPSTLDLWRFSETGGDHLIGTEARYVKAGPAEYFDSVLVNRSLSRGVFFCCDDHCLTASGACQASHWRDNLLNQLLDPTSASGELKNIRSDDSHALDYIGYENLGIEIGPSRFLYARYLWRDLRATWWPYPLPQDPKPLPGFPPLPDPPSPPFAPNVGVVLGFDLGVAGPLFENRRSAVGFASFANAQQNQYPVVAALPYNKYDINLNPPRPRPEFLPASFQNLYFISDQSNGVPFRAHALFSESGAQFDPTLGPYGGYHLALAIDGDGDEVVGDVDGVLTVDLLADEKGVPDGRAQNVFTIGTNHIDNSFRAFDALALCLCDVRATEIEPNDTPPQATYLGAVGFSAVLGSLPSGDRDYYRFVVQPTNALAWITVDTGGPASAGAGSRDSVLTLLGNDAKTTVELDDDDGSGNGADSSLESGEASAIAGCTLAKPGDYYIEVQAKDTNKVLSPYRLLLTVTTGPIPTEREPNNTPATATPIVTPVAPTGVRSGNIDGTDLDYYAVTVSGRSLLHISADGDPERAGANPDLVVDLLAPDGTTLRFSANSSTAVGTPAPPAEGFAYVVPMRGTYFVRVKDASGKGGTYRLMVSACTAKDIPTLRVNSLSADGIALSWPAQAHGFRLQTSTDLVKWFDVPQGTFNCFEDNIHALVPGKSAQQFFRLVAE